VIEIRYRHRMKRNHSCSAELRLDTNDRKSDDCPICEAPSLSQIFNLEKQYEELCRLRERVRIAERQIN
jgi:hypothetical protein